MRKKIQTPIKNKDRLKWNFTMGLLHGIFFNGAMGFSDSNTVLPAFISSLTHSKILLGLFASTIEGGGFSRLGSVIPQLFVANKVETSTFLAPTALFPLIGGAIIQYTSFLFLFSLTTLFVFIGFLLSLKLKEPRNI